MLRLSIILALAWPSLVGRANEVAGSTITVDLELSSGMVSGSLSRCICFQPFDCFRFPTEQCLEVTFIDGIALDITIPVERATYQCLEARDPLHTLRSISEVASDGNQLSASFVNDPASGGNWLITGNLNDDILIDILDIGTYKFEIDRGASYPDGNTTCNTIAPHGDVNGDGDVNNFDFSIIAFSNFLSARKLGCWELVCDCANPEADSDNDNVPDCVDVCPNIDDTLFAPGCADAIPTVSEWGVVVLALSLLVTGKVWFGRRRVDATESGTY